MSACGINHALAYRSHTGKHAALKRLTRMSQSCASWHEQLVKTYQSPAVTLEAALTQHAVVARFWNAHMEDIGAS